MTTQKHDNMGGAAAGGGGPEGEAAASGCSRGPSSTARAAAACSAEAPRAKLLLPAHLSFCCSMGMLAASFRSGSLVLACEGGGTRQRVSSGNER